MTVYGTFYSVIFICPSQEEPYFLEGCETHLHARHLHTVHFIVLLLGLTSKEQRKEDVEHLVLHHSFHFGSPLDMALLAPYVEDLVW